MRRIVTALIVAACLLNVSNSFANPKVRLSTNLGDIDIELYPDKAPETVNNFLSYVDDDFYSNTLFHRVIDNFMIQGGGYTTDYVKKETKAPVLNESGNGLSNKQATIAMARTGNPHSATAQFFINVKNNGFLDFEMMQAGPVNTVRRSQLGIQDPLTGKITTNDCDGKRIQRNTLAKAENSDEGYICLMKAVLNQPEYSLDSELEKCLNNIQTLKQDGTIKPDGTCSEYISARHNNLKLVHVRWGYTVFGKVITGMDIVEQIKSTPTGSDGPFNKDVPLEPVVIQSITRLNN